MRRLVGGMAIFTVAIVALSWAVADDKEIAKEITERLQQEQRFGNLQDFDIDLKVAEGHVLLQGRVCTPDQQTLALDIAERVNGVKRVVNDLEVATAPEEEAKVTDQRDDRAIAAEIAQRLRKLKAAGLLEGFRIDIDVQQGKVALDGHVSDADQMDLIVSTARRVEGVLDTVCHLTVSETATASSESAAQTSEPVLASTLSDEEIAAQIAASLRRYKEMGTLAGFDIDMSVNNGVVSLEGLVSSEEQQQLALDIAENANGVQEVVNRLAIQGPANYQAPAVHTAQLAAYQTEETSVEPDAFLPTPAIEPIAEEHVGVPDDFRIGEELTQQLRQAKLQGVLQGFGIGVHVEQGTVWLKGRVSSAEQQQFALDMASRIEGVRDVVNELSVAELPAAPAKQRLPLEIAEEISERLVAAEQQGRLLGSRFDVKVDGGDVWLGGFVASAEQEQLAVDIASQVAGVKKVLNALSVTNAMGATTQLASLQMPRTAASATPELSAKADLPAAVDAGPTAAATTSVQPLISGPARLAVTLPTDASFQQDSGAAAENARDATVIPATNLATAPATTAAAQPGAQVVRVPMAQPVMYPQMVTTYPPMGAAGHNQPRPISPADRMVYAGAAVLGAPIMAVNHMVGGGGPASMPGPGQAVVPARYDHPNLPGYAWPSYAAHPNYAAVTYPKQYSPTAWPYIGPFYPYPQVPLGWRKVTMKWDDGWWQLNFCSK